MEQTQKPPLTDEQVNAIAEVARAKAEMIHRVYQSHTRWLFWLWLFLVLVFSWPAFAAVSANIESMPIIVLFGSTFMSFLITGGYVFQEVRKLHRRIDGLLNLIGKK
jgi:uncharacterized membrane protein (DUF485 family)